MIKITNGTDVKVVTKGMFDSLYSYMGYRPVGQKVESKPVIEEKKEEIQEPSVEKEEKVEVKEVHKERFNNKK